MNFPKPQVYLSLEVFNLFTHMYKAVDLNAVIAGPNTVIKINFHLPGKVGGGILLIVKTDCVNFKWTIIYELHGPVYNYHYVVNKIRN